MNAIAAIKAMLRGNQVIARDLVVREFSELEPTHLLIMRMSTSSSWGWYRRSVNRIRS